jgi:hypothetical protein
MTKVIAVFYLCLEGQIAVLPNVRTGASKTQSPAPFGTHWYKAVNVRKQIIRLNCGTYVLE